MRMKISERTDLISWHNKEKIKSFQYNQYKWPTPRFAKVASWLEALPFRGSSTPTQILYFLAWTFEQGVSICQIQNYHCAGETAKSKLLQSFEPLYWLGLVLSGRFEWVANFSAGWMTSAALGTAWHRLHNLCKFAQTLQASSTLHRAIIRVIKQTLNIIINLYVCVCVFCQGVKIGWWWCHLSQPQPFVE